MSDDQDGEAEPPGAHQTVTPSSGSARNRMISTAISSTSTLMIRRKLGSIGSRSIA